MVANPGKEGRADVQIGADWVRARLDDPGVMLSEADQDQDNIKWTRRSFLCRCRHSRSAHRHYRSGSDCAVCECPRLSRWNPALRLRRPGS